MLNDSKFKSQLKKSLIIINIFFGILLLVLTLTWLLVLKPIRTETATRFEHYAHFNLDHLPEIANKIDSIYFNESELATQEEEYSSAELAIAGTNDEGEEAEELLDEAEEILNKSNNIINNKLQGKQVSKKGKKQPDRNIVKEGGSKRRPKVSIIVTSLGLNRKSTELALTLPNECALGFLPYTNTLKPLLHKAQSKGHEIYLYLPLQSSRSYENPGKYALMNNLPPEENFGRLNLILNSHARYDGVYSSFKEIFTANPQSCELILEHLEDKNLIFLLGKLQTTKQLNHLKKRSNLVYNNIILDKDPDEESINKNFEYMIKIAREQGTALGYAQGYTMTIEMIKKWIPKLRERGISLVPVSELKKIRN